MRKHRLAAGASERDVQNLIDTLIGVAEPIEVHYQWRQQLSDVGDEMVLEPAAEKLTAITTAEAIFAERKNRGNPKEAIRFPTRGGSEPPRQDDLLPQD